MVSAAPSMYAPYGQGNVISPAVMAPAFGGSYAAPSLNSGFQLGPATMQYAASPGSLPVAVSPALGAMDPGFSNGGRAPTSPGGQGQSQGARSSTAVMTMLDPTEQDSDLMERMGDGMFTGSEATGKVPLVSLGCSCGPKLTFKDIGRGAETLPFDWARTRIEGVVHFLSKDFQGFFDTAKNSIHYKDENGAEWHAFRSPIHSFWHDDPFAPAMRERYTRRITRLFSMEARSQPILFVRSAASTNEVARAGELLQLLIQKFGPQAKLLLLLDFQGRQAVGPCVVAGLDNLLIWYFDTERAPSARAPYAQPVSSALEWAIGQPINARRLPDLNAAQSMAIPNDWGMYGAARVPAFV